jgi:hypothetical protein
VLRQPTTKSDDGIPEIISVASVKHVSLRMTKMSPLLGRSKLQANAGVCLRASHHHSLLHPFHGTRKHPTFLTLLQFNQNL